jgi:hypothetical protein
LFCYEWTHGFIDAFEHESSGGYFSVTHHVYGDLESGRVHSFIAIVSRETGATVYVDDGFWDGYYAHTTMPMGGRYSTPFSFAGGDELDKKNCNLPAIYDHNNERVGTR